MQALGMGNSIGRTSYEVLDYRKDSRPTVDDKVREYFSNMTSKNIAQVNTTIYSDKDGNIVGSVWHNKIFYSDRFATQIRTKDGIYQDLDGDNKIEQFHKFKSNFLA